MHFAFKQVICTSSHVVSLPLTKKVAAPRYKKPDSTSTLMKGKESYILLQLGIKRANRTISSLRVDLSVR